MPSPPSRRGAPAPNADGFSAQDTAAVVARPEDAATTEEAQKARALLLLKAPEDEETEADDSSSVATASESVGIWGPDGIPRATGRRALFDVGGLVKAPAKGYSARWSADNRVGLVCGTTIYVHSLGISHRQEDGPGVTFLPGHADFVKFDLGTVPEYEVGMTAARRLQLAPVAGCKKLGGGFGGAMVQSRPSFRAFDWSPPMPSCGGECLMVTCTSDHRVGVFSVPEGRQSTWHEVACLSDELENQVKELKYTPRQASIPGVCVPVDSPIEIVRKKALLSSLSVAWSQRIGGRRGSGGNICTWIAVGAVGSLAVFVHSTAATHGLAVSSEPPHTFVCSDLVSLPGAASYVTALAWLDSGPEPSGGGVAGGCPALVSGTGSGMVVLWDTNAAIGSASDKVALTPLQVICRADNSPVLSLLPAPWISPSKGNSSARSARLSVAKGTGIWIWEHGCDPWRTGNDVGACGTKRAHPASDGDAHPDAKHGKAASGMPTVTREPHPSSTVGQVYLLPMAGPGIISGVAWAHDLSPVKSEAAEDGRLERALLFVSNVESRIYGYEGPWSNTHGIDADARLVLSTSDMFREQPVDAESVWGVAASPNALVCAMLVENTDVGKFSSTAESMFTNHRARVSYSLRPGLTTGHMVEFLAEKLETLKSRGSTSGLTPTELWELAECFIAYATEPADILANAVTRVNDEFEESLLLKIRRALERAVFERRLSSCKQHLVNASSGVASVYTPAKFTGHGAVGAPQAAMFAHHEFAMRRAHVMKTMQALQLPRPSDLDPQVRRAAWRMVLWSEQCQKAAGDSSVDCTKQIIDLSAALRKRLLEGMNDDAAAAEQKVAEEVCPACKGNLTATGLVFASCASNHRWKRCCYSLELLGLQKDEPGGWLRSSIWPSCTARAAVAWSLSAVLGQPAPLCPATATVMMPARGTL